MSPTKRNKPTVAGPLKCLRCSAPAGKRVWFRDAVSWSWTDASNVGLGITYWPEAVRVVLDGGRCQRCRNEGSL